MDGEDPSKVEMKVGGNVKKEELANIVKNAQNETQKPATDKILGKLNEKEEKAEANR